MNAETELNDALYSLIEGARFAPQLSRGDREQRVDKAVKAIESLIDKRVAEAVRARAVGFKWPE